MVGPVFRPPDGQQLAFEGLDASMLEINPCLITKEGDVLALDAKVKNLVLFHHHPDHSDDELDRVLEVARSEFPNTVASHEGLELPL